MFKHEKRRSLFFKIITLFIIIFFVINFFLISNKSKKTQVFQFFLTINQSLSIPLIYASYKNIFSFIDNLKNFRVSKDFEKINIILNKTNYNKLSNEVNSLKKNAIQGAILAKGKDPNKYKAKINYKNKSIPATVELKGQFISHIQYDNSWSLEIKLKKGHTIKGYKNFSIQNFNQRQFPYNAILNDIYNTEKFTTKDYSPLKVHVNGISWGVMYAEEEFSEVFFERRKIKNPVVFSIGDKSKYGNTYLKLKSNNINFNDNEILDYIKLDLNNFFRVNISGKNIKKDHQIEQNSINSVKKNIYQILNFDSQILSDYQFNLLKKDFIKLYALSIIFCEDHALADYNLNYFLNHYDHKIEIIPGDFSYSNYVNYKPYDKKNFTKFKNVKCNLDNLIKSYDYKFLKLINDKENLNQLILYISNNYDRLVDQYNKKLSDLSIQYSFDKDYFKIKKIKNYDVKILDQIKKIKNSNPKIQEKKKNLNNSYNFEKKFEKDLDYFLNNESIFIINLTRFPIIINSYNLGGEFDYIINKELNPSSLQKLTVQEYKYLPSRSNNKIKINYKLFNKKLSKETSISNNFSKFLNTNLLKVNNNTKTFTFVDKNLFINEPIVVPQGYNLNVSKGTELKFSENSFILLLGGKVTFKGSLNDPIIFKSNNKDLYWKGIHVIQGKNDISILKNVYFENLNFHKSEFNLTGGINFYRGKVDLKNVSIENCISEDCLNLVETYANLKNISVKSSTSDAIDFDFSDGILDTANFENIGGDALDFSGSNFEITNTVIKNVKDKGISNGEASNLQLNALRVSKSKIGIANKDGSNLKGENIKLIDNYLDVAAYQKKSFYDKSKLQVLNLIGNSNFYIEKGHSVEINNKVLRNIIPENKSISK